MVPRLGAYLLGLETPEHLERKPTTGGLFENIVVINALKSRLNKGQAPRLYFYTKRRLG